MDQPLQYNGRVSREDQERNIPKDLPYTLSREELSTIILEKRVPLISKEFEDVFYFIKKGNFGRSVSFFGSAQTLPSDPAYKQAEALAGKLAKMGLSVITGGGPGIMEAANKGAFEAGGRSVGINIKLRKEQGDNSFLTDNVLCYYFFVRKVALSFAAEAYIFFPGGFGTLDEFFELVTLIKNEKVKPTPIILVGRNYWSALESFLKETVLKRNAITEKDMGIYTITDDEEEILKIVSHS